MGHLKFREIKISEFEESEVVNRLIRISISLRILDGRFTRKFPGAKSLLSISGELIKDVNDPESEALTMREACNKIVHAEFYRINKNELMSVYLSHSPVVELTGCLHHKKWMATVDINLFVREAYHVTHAVLANMCETPIDEP